MEMAGDPREGPSTERAFEAEPLPAWTEQITARAVVASMLLGAVFSAAVMKLSFTSGMMPALNVSAGLLSLFVLKTWTRVLGRCGVLHRPFTRQENTIVQTCVVACASMAASGGFGTYILGMGQKAAGESKGGKDAVNISEPTLGRVIGFFFLVSFVGLFAIVPMRKTMIIHHRLTYPSGTATAMLINSFHTPQGAKQAKKQVSFMLKSFLGSLFWSIFQWFYSAGPDCGFGAFPTFGLKAYQKGFYFNFSATYVGVGMICPHLINISMLVGSLISTGILWPYIESKKGDWYDARLSDYSIKGIYGYKVFICIAIILGDGLFQLLAILCRTVHAMRTKRQQAATATTPFPNANAKQCPAQCFDERRRTQVFLRDSIPNSFAAGGYLLLAAVSTAAIPHIYPQLKYRHVAVAYIAAPFLAFCNAYSTGMADLNISGEYSKLVILIFALWIGADSGGVVGSLAICGVVTAIVATAGDFMHDFKAGYLTLTSPRSMFVSQVIGTALGCLINPGIFWIFFNFYNSGTDDAIYQAPYAKVYRAIAILGAGGFKNFPKHCIELSIPFFVLALAMRALKEVATHKNWRFQCYIPSIVCMSVSLLVLPTIPVDMCVGSLILFVWNWRDKGSAQLYGAVLASGLLCGDGVFSIPYALFAIYGVNPPICIRFLSRDVNVKVDGFLKSLSLS